MKRLFHLPFAKYTYVYFNGKEKINKRAINEIPEKGIWRVRISIKTGDVWDFDDMKLIWKLKEKINE